MTVAAPPLIAAVVVGLGISIFQALTQIQEMTLSYVPKIVVTMVATVLSLPLAYAALRTFWDEVIQLIIGL
jgi:flagellar biosynthetic protein FliQ